MEVTPQLMGKQVTTQMELTTMKRREEKKANIMTDQFTEIKNLKRPVKSYPASPLHQSFLVTYLPCSFI